MGGGSSRVCVVIRWMVYVTVTSGRPPGGSHPAPPRHQPLRPLHDRYTTVTRSLDLRGPASQSVYGFTDLRI